MKPKSTLKLALCAAGFSALALALMGSARAQVINVNFDGGNGSSYDLNGTASGPTVAPLSYTGTTWTDDSTGSAGTGLLDSNGTPTSVGFTLVGGTANGASGGGTGFNTPTVIFRAIEYTLAGNTETLTLNGLSQGTNYNLALVGVYENASGSDIRGASFTVNGTTLTDTGVAGNPSGNTFVAGPGAGSDYVEFTNLQADLSGDIVITIGSQGSDPTGQINGFQLQQVPEIPEPSTVALIGLGALGLAFLIRRHRTA